MLRGVLIVIVIGGIVLAGAFFYVSREKAAPEPAIVPVPEQLPTPIEPAPPPEPQPTAALEDAPLQQGPLERPFAAATTEYEEAKTALEEEFEKQATDANPELIEPVKENLGLIERAVMEITMALAENPDNEPLQQRLLDTYDDQIQLLRKALRLTAGEE